MTTLTIVVVANHLQLSACRTSNEIKDLEDDFALKLWDIKKWVKVNIDLLGCIKYTKLKRRIKLTIKLIEI